MTQPAEVEYASQDYQDWLADLKATALLQTHNQAQAIMRGVFQELRRHMGTEAVLGFADSLPPLPRGIFLEKWRPAPPAPLASAGDFAASLAAHLAPHVIPPESAAADVFAVLARHAGPARAAAMAAALPAALLPLWPPQVPRSPPPPSYMRKGAAD